MDGLAGRLGSAGIGRSPREMLSYDDLGLSARWPSTWPTTGSRSTSSCPSRGGLFLGRELRRALDGKYLLGMDVEFHPGVDERLELPDVLPLPLTGAG